MSEEGGAAVGADGAGEAEGSAGPADAGAEFHHGLVEIAGMGGVEEGLGEGPEGRGGGGGIAVEGGIGEEAGKEADDVAVDHSDGEAAGDAADGGGGVGADSGQAGPVFRSDGGGGAGGEGLGEGVEEAGAAVIAEALPGFEDFLRRGGGEGGKVGEALHPAGEVGENGGDLGLLKHEFGDHGGVEGGVGAPGEGALFGPIPGEEIRGEGGRSKGRRREGGRRGGRAAGRHWAGGKVAGGRRFGNNSGRVLPWAWGVGHAGVFYGETETAGSGGGAQEGALYPEDGGS